MKAVILAAGVGTRLDRPDAPKPLINIGNKPLILWCIDYLQEAGIEKVYIVIEPNRGDFIKKELTGNNAIKVPIEYIYAQSHGKDMADSIKSISSSLSESLIVTAADLIVETNPYIPLMEKISSLNNGAIQGKILAVIVTSKESNERSGSSVGIKLQGETITSVERGVKDTNGLDFGAYYFDSKVLKEIKDWKESKIEELLNRLAKEQKLLAVDLKDVEWYDINDPKTALRAEIFARRKFFGQPHTLPQKKKFSSIPTHYTFFRNKKLESALMIEKGILNKIGEIEVFPQNKIESPHFLLTDSIVDKIYADKILYGFRNAGFNVHKLVMPAGEHHKNIRTFMDLSEQMFVHGLDEGTFIISLGGGIVNNMAGFMASTIYRGLGLIHIPTTTMAQLDAAIDFKQGVNSIKGKNHIGSYYPASKIIIDPETLSTLDQRHICNGLAESIKHAIAHDERLFKFFMEYQGDIKDIEFLTQVTKMTVDLKVELLNGDEKDEYNEMIPQYGHCIGHAIEHLSAYELLHGEAVSIGMCISAEIAKLLGIAEESTLQAQYEICEKFGLPIRVPKDIGAEDIINVIKYDKHYLGHIPRMGLVEKIGKIWKDSGSYAIPIDYPIIERGVNINKARGS